MRNVDSIRVLLLIAAIVLPAHLAGAKPTDARNRKFAAADRKAALAWQVSSRNLLADLMSIGDLIRAEASADGIPFKPTVKSTEVHQEYTLYELALNSTPGRRFKIILTVPKNAAKRSCPAVVCIHGHGGHRRATYAPGGAYRGFALALAKRGYVTIATDVGLHKVREKGRTLMGERLWDVMRCVTYVAARPEVDPKRIGCAGLSLGGEMTMWLGAMDTRIVATVSAGFLTTVANMRRGHCRCWEFPNLTANFDFADIYSLTAPRALLCQNGRKEPSRGGFPVAIATKAMAEIQACYKVLGRGDNVALIVHDEGHVVDLPSCLAFLDKHLRPKAKGGQ